MKPSRLALIAPRIGRAHAAEREARRRRQTAAMMRRSVRLTIRARSICPKGQVFLMADVDHPEVAPLGIDILDSPAVT